MGIPKEIICEVYNVFWDWSADFVDLSVKIWLYRFCKFHIFISVVFASVAIVLFLYWRFSIKCQVDNEMPDHMLQPHESLQC